MRKIAQKFAKKNFPVAQKFQPFRRNPIYLPFVYHVFTMYLPCLYHVFTIYLPYIYYVFTMYSPCIYHVFTMSLPYNYLILPYNYLIFTIVYHVFTMYQTRLTMDDFEDFSFFLCEFERFKNLFFIFSTVQLIFT